LGIGAGLCEDRPQVEPGRTLALAEVMPHLARRGARREPVEERRRSGRARTVMQNERLTTPVQFRHHRQEGRDADPGRDHHMARTGAHRKVVARK
jgi:hypothetical protein